MYEKEAKSEAKSIQLQFAGLSGLPFAEPIQHASDFSKFSLREENSSEDSQMLKMRRNNFVLATKKMLSSAYAERA